MPKGNYIQGNDNAFSAQLKTFKNNIGSYAATLGVSPAQVTAQAADCDYLEYVLKCLGIMQNAAQQWTGWKDLTRDGGTPPVAGAPVPPALPAAVPAVAPGVEVRFRALVKQIKASTNYNVSIGEALGIEGAQQTPPDYTTLQPQIDATVSGNQVLVDWGWGGYGAFLDLCELQVDRGDGKGFVLLAFDSTPRLHRHRALSRRAGEMDLPRHLPPGRCPGGPLEPARERDRAGVKRTSEECRNKNENREIRQPREREFSRSCLSSISQFKSQLLKQKQNEQKTILLLGVTGG